MRLDELLERLTEIRDKNPLFARLDVKYDDKYQGFTSIEDINVYHDEIIIY